MAEFGYFKDLGSNLDSVCSVLQQQVVLLLFFFKSWSSTSVVTTGL